MTAKNGAGSANGEEKSPLASALSTANMCELSWSAANEFCKMSVYTVPAGLVRVTQ